METQALRLEGGDAFVKTWILLILAGLLAYGAFIQPVDSDSSWPDEGHKLGIHGILAGDILAYVEHAADAGMPLSVVKAVDDMTYLARVKQISPETLTVARFTSQHEGAALVNDPDTDLAWYAGEIMGTIFDRLEEQPELAAVVDYWEPINEPLGGGVPTDAYERLAQLMVHCIDLAEQQGLHLALFSFSAGTPEWADMMAIVETGVFSRAKAGGHILALHEGVYGDNPINKWYGPAHSIPGAPEIPDAGALTGRYRYWYHLLQQRDEVVPLFISEFYAGNGYGDDANLDDIVARMAWYDRQLQRNSYALGFAPFTLGPTEQWIGEDYAFVYQALFGGRAEPNDVSPAAFLPIFSKKVRRPSLRFGFVPLVTNNSSARQDPSFGGKGEEPSVRQSRSNNPFARPAR